MEQKLVEKKITKAIDQVKSTGKSVTITLSLSGVYVKDVIVNIDTIAKFFDRYVLFYNLGPRCLVYYDKITNISIH